jgi:hypothetical protein
MFLINKKQHELVDFLMLQKRSEKGYFYYKYTSDRHVQYHVSDFIGNYYIFSFLHL